MSPEVGVLDDAALAEALAEHPSSTMVMLADMMTATDENLRRAVGRIAAQLVLDRAQRGRVRARGVRRLRRVPASSGGELDVDASMEQLVHAAAEQRMPVLDDLTAQEWGQTDLALALVVDRSGSMTGPRLATAAVAAAACATRAPGQYAVIAFARDVDLVRPLAAETGATTTVDRMLRLRGHGMTSLCAALREAQVQLREARPGRRVVLLLSDARGTDGDADATAAVARSLTASGVELVILSPADDSDEAAALAAAADARFAAVGEVDTVPALLERLLG